MVAGLKWVAAFKSEYPAGFFGIRSKGQAAAFNLTRDSVGESRLIERAFGFGPCALTEAVQLVGERLKAA